MPKTGSSAIQAFLALNEEFLLANDCQYPNHTGFKQAYQTSAGNVAYMAKWIENQNHHALEALLSHTTAKNIVLSSEILFMAMKKYPAKFAKFLVDRSFTIICYVREFTDLMESCMNQQIKNHFRVNYRDVDTLSEQFDYYSCLLNALKYFENSDIIVKKYDHDSFHQGLIYADFMQILGVELDATVVHPERVVNPSLNRDAIELRIMLNKVFFAQDDVELKYRFNGMLAKYSVESVDQAHTLPLLTPKLKEYLHEKFKEQESALMKCYFPEMDANESLFMSTKKNQHVYAGLSVERLAALLAFIRDHDHHLYEIIVAFCHDHMKNHRDKALMIDATNVIQNHC